MKRSAIVYMETELTQEEFEVWLLKTLKNISVHPDKTEVEGIEDIICL